MVQWMGRLPGVAWLRRRAHAEGRENAEAVLEALPAWLHELGMPERVPPRVRVALRRWHWADVYTSTLRFFWIFAGFLWVLEVARLTVHQIQGWRDILVLPDPMDVDILWKDISKDTLWDTCWDLLMAISAVVYVWGILALITLPAWMSWMSLRGLPAGPFVRARTRRRYALVECAVEAIFHCAAAHGAGGEYRMTALRRAAIALEQVHRELGRAHRSWATSPWRSHRRHLLKTHTGRVVAALQKTEALIDEDSQQALKDLGAMLLKIAARYTDGQVGKLLDPAELDGLEPVANREPVRLAVAAIAVAAAGAGIAFLDLPGGAETYLVGGIGAGIVALLYGRRAHRGLDVLDAVRGVQRP